jgi:hypothetical protein
MSKPFAMRLPPLMRSVLEEHAANAGRSLGEEVRLRLDYTLKEGLVMMQETTAVKAKS